MALVEDASVFDVTFSANYTLGGLTIIPEFRVDVVSEDVFLDEDLAPMGNLSSFVLGAVYAF